MAKQREDEQKRRIKNWKKKIKCEALKEKIRIEAEQKDKDKELERA